MQHEKLYNLENGAYWNCLQKNVKNCVTNFCNIKKLVTQNFVLFEKRKISGLLEIVELFKLHLMAYFALYYKVLTV